MRLLVLYHGGFCYIGAVRHYLDALRQHSRHEVRYFNINQGLHGYNLSHFDLRGFDAVILNYCVASSIRQPPPGFDKSVLERALVRYPGVKLLILQDEQDSLSVMTAHMRRVGYQVALTCLPVEEATRLYAGAGPIEFRRVLTGYVSSEMERWAESRPPLAERPITIGYRGRELAWRLGDAGWHKAEIGRRFAVACVRRGIAADIAIDERARLYGDAWPAFLKRCRAVLGTPSGSNTIDLDGSLHARMVELFEGGCETYESVRDEVMAQAIGFDATQSSPRVFEAVACGCALVLLRGNYSDVLRLGEHCLVVEPDYSNVNEVVEQVADTDRLQEMADRAFAHVFGQRQLFFPHFVAQVNELIERHARLPAAQVALPAVGHEPYPARTAVGVW